MSDEPWEADRPLTEAMARAAIAASFPGIDASALTPLGSGWEFDAWLTGDGWVFRFPRRAHCADLIEPERRVHGLVAGVLPPGVAVPRVELVGAPAAAFPYRFGGHRLIPGVGADALAPEHLPALARSLGAALGAIHAVPEGAARAAGVAERPADDEGGRAWLEHRMRAASALRGLDAVVDEALDQVQGVSLPFARYEGPLRLIHDDLGPDHIIADPSTGRLAGIIDWTDASLGDPARDFVGLAVWLGWDLTGEVLRSYPMPMDRDFRERLGAMARVLSVMWLAEAHERRGDVAKHIAWVRNAFAAAPMEQELF